jgi:hypothetical protein
MSSGGWLYAGPVFAHGHLRLYLLSLVAARPMHGYQLIQALSDRFGGTYFPSAGTIYPRLANEVRHSVNDAMKALRADLAAAARDAGADARDAARTGRSGRLDTEIAGLISTELTALQREIIAALRR